MEHLETGSHVSRLTVTGGRQSTVSREITAFRKNLYSEKILINQGFNRIPSVTRLTVNYCRKLTNVSYRQSVPPKGGKPTWRYH